MIERTLAKVDGASSHPVSLLVRILVVDDEPIIQEIIARKLSSLGYQCEGCEDGSLALKLLETRDYDLVITDIKMPGIGGIDLLKAAKVIQPGIAVILITGYVDFETAVDSLKEGAYDYLQKPFSLEELSISVDRALEKRRLLLENRRYQETLEDQVSSATQQLQQTLNTLHSNYHATLLALSTALDSRDADTEGHTLKVTLYTRRLAKRLEIGDVDLQVIEQGALLHDIGKIGVPDRILRKSERLTEEEWAMMRRHPEIGYRILCGIKFLQGAARLVLQHQERFDGTGYPGGLKREEIGLGARIFAVADVLDCVTSNRPFQKAKSFEAARDEIAGVSGTQLDPAIVQKFLEVPLEEWSAIQWEVASQRDRSAKAT